MAVALAFFFGFGWIVLVTTGRGGVCSSNCTSVGSEPSAADVATEVVEAVAPAVADVVANAQPVIDMPDPIDAAAGDAIRMEASSDAEVRRIREEADARIRVIEAEARAAAGIIETAADAAPEPEVVELEPDPVTPDPGAALMAYVEKRSPLFTL